MLTMSVILLLLAFIVSVLLTDRYDASRLFAYVWFGQAILGLILFRGIYKFTGYSFIYYAAAIFMASLGSVIAKSIFHKETRSIKNSASEKTEQFIIQINQRSLTKLFYFCLLLGLLYPIFFFFRQGINIGSLFNLESLFSINNELAKARYSGDHTSKLTDQLFLPFLYTLPLLGGFRAILCNRTISNLLITQIPAFLVVLTANTKAVLVATLFMYISSFITSWIFFGKKIENKKRLMTKVIIGMTAFMLIMGGSMILRTGGYKGEKSILFAQKRLTTYSLGQIAAFDSWIENHTNNQASHYTMGAMTFLGPTSALGFKERVKGVYVDYFEKRNFHGERVGTNIYTIFRGLISDFGFFGSLISIFILFFTTSIAYHRIKQQKIDQRPFPIISYALLSSTIFSIFFSLFISAWTYNSFILAYILLFFALRHLNIKSSTRTLSTKCLTE